MRTIFCICLVFVTSHVTAQSKLERMRAALPKTDELEALTPLKPSNEAYDYFRDSLVPIEQMINQFVLTAGRNRKSTIQSSSTLRALSRVAYAEIKSITKSRHKSILSVRKKLRRAFLASSCGFRIINYVAFEFEIVKPTANFYYDKHGPDGGFNLYKGNKKPQSTDEQEEVEPPSPLEKYTLKELYTRMSRKMNGQFARHLRNKDVKAMGVHVTLLPNTIYRHKIPRVRVVIIYGVSRFQDIKKNRKWLKWHTTNATS